MPSLSVYIDYDGLGEIRWIRWNHNYSSSRSKLRCGC